MDDMDEKRKQELRDIAEQIIARVPQRCTSLIKIEELTADAAILHFEDVDDGTQALMYEFRDGKPVHLSTEASHPA